MAETGEYENIAQHLEWLAQQLRSGQVRDVSEEATFHHNGPIIGATTHTYSVTFGGLVDWSDEPKTVPRENLGVPGSAG